MKYIIKKELVINESNNFQAVLKKLANQLIKISPELNNSKLNYFLLNVKTPSEFKDNFLKLHTLFKNEKSIYKKSLLIADDYYIFKYYTNEEIGDIEIKITSKRIEVKYAIKSSYYEKNQKYFSFTNWKLIDSDSDFNCNFEPELVE